jgi:hypothetical protein
MRSLSPFSRQDLIDAKRNRKRQKRASRDEKDFIARICAVNLIDSPCPLPFVGGMDGGDGCEYAPKLAQRYVSSYGKKRECRELVSKH